MSEYWEIIVVMMIFYALQWDILTRSFREINQRLFSISCDLNRLEDKIDGVDRSSYRN